MSTVYSLVNDEGRVGKTSRICFGSMSGLETIHFDTLTPREGYRHGGFIAPKVKKVIFHGAECDGGSEFEKYVKQLAPLVTQALKSPFFKEGHFSWDEDESELTVETNDEISIEQVMLGLFAIRNLYDYPAVRRSFLMMTEEGIPSDEAIVLANVFCAGMSAVGGNNYTFYNLDGDGAIVPYDARLADVVGLMRTGITDSNQGRWGAHDCGYLTYDHDEWDDDSDDMLVESTRVGCEGMDGFLATEIWRDSVISRSMTKENFITQIKRIAAYV